jgi:NAD(P)H-dependent FMN reductase
MMQKRVDYLFAECSHKAAGFVGYGAAGGARAIEQLGLVLGELHVAAVRSQVLLSLVTNFEALTRSRDQRSHRVGFGAEATPRRRRSAMNAFRALVVVSTASRSS